ncbi:SIS domain-containing protein [Caldisericum sp.]|uniref:SIS domain-containing protein n=1 Tax=Caldisericum sp. TaxID=2499687 RepID=UPI003D12083F
MKKIVQIVEETIEKDVSLLNGINVQLQYISNELENFLDSIVNCKGRVFVVGVGTSYFTAGRFAHLLTCSGIYSHLLEPALMLHGGSGVITREDILIFISKGGETSELVQLAEIARNLGARTFAITENKLSTLARKCDFIISLDLSGADIMEVIATGSSTTLSAFFDGICAAVVSAVGYRKEVFRLIHPGGAVGKKLRGKKTR